MIVRDDEGALALAAAIVRCAAEDYRSGSRDPDLLAFLEEAGLLQRLDLVQTQRQFNRHGLGDRRQVKRYLRSEPGRRERHGRQQHALCVA